MDAESGRLTDEVWVVWEPLVVRAKGTWAGSKPATSDRVFLEALLHMGRIRVQVASAARPLRGLGRRLQPLPPLGGRRRLRPPPRGAGGAQRARPGGPAQPGLHRLPRPRQRRGGAAEKGGADAQALGRSRGGFTTKVHLAASDERTAVAVLLTPGQASDIRQADALVDAACEATGGSPGQVLADKGYDADAFREGLVAADIYPVIPNKANRVEPWPFDADEYKGRNVVERLVGRLKQFRRVATRYDKLAGTFLAFVHLALSQIATRPVRYAAKPTRSVNTA